MTGGKVLAVLFITALFAIVIGVSLWTRPRPRPSGCPCQRCAGADHMAIADAVREQPWRYPCGCTPARKCLLHDGDYWRELERREGIDRL